MKIFKIFKNIIMPKKKLLRIKYFYSDVNFCHSLIFVPSAKYEFELLYILVSCP